ncbi:MAG: MBL fold metallo-hydrolase [Myxococcota bacterium]
MSRRRPLLILLLLTAVVVTGLAIAQRHALLVFVLATDAPPPPLPPTDEGPGVHWADDWFTVEEIAPDTWAIGEPRFHQSNFSYLIAGRERAVLFDAGPGIRDLRPIARRLTSRSILFVPSHFHYDHVGNAITFEHVAVIDLPGLRARAPRGRLSLTAAEHLGAMEGFERVPLEVDRWLAPGESIELGGRRLEVLYTPGHTPDSISLLDPDARLLFTGDFLYPGPLFAFLSNSSLGDYRRAAATVLARVDPDARLYGAHRAAPPGAPRLAMDDVRDLAVTLRALAAGELDGEGVYPVRYGVNERLELLAEPRWLARWSEFHPDFGPRPR